jgi:hypothetical protein
MADRKSERDQLARILATRQVTPAVQNAPYVRPGATGFNTQLDPLNEMAFRQWAAQNKVPFNPDAPATDYDMRGFYQGLQQQNPRATSSINPNDQQLHYPDYWKTPLHSTFSQDSQWATPVAPRWNEGDQLVAPGGRILFDEKAE